MAKPATAATAAPAARTVPSFSSTAPSTIERTPLFYIDGVEYSIPTRVPPAIFLNYLRRLRDGVDSDVAQAHLIDEVLGSDAMDALAACPSVGPDDFKTIMAVVNEIAAGASKDYGGN